MPSLSAEDVLEGYTLGIFPMGEPDSSDVYWYAPDPRGIIPLDEFHVPKTLAQQVRQERFEIVTDRSFSQVICECADRPETWITPEIMRVYRQLHEMGFAHTVECWQDGELAGGLYGVALGAAFFGESMFFRKRNASKIALVHLVKQLRAGGYSLLDVQFSTSHLEQFGAKDIERAHFEKLLDKALREHATWWPIEE